jgi:hypothetical protein
MKIREITESLVSEKCNVKLGAIKSRGYFNGDFLCSATREIGDTEEDSNFSPPFRG